MSTTASSIVEASSTPNSWDAAKKIISTSTTASSLNNQTQKSIKELFYNGTGYYIEDEVEPGNRDSVVLVYGSHLSLLGFVFFPRSE
jgi:hypothetical protein